jgi:hypothetical protein
MSFSKLMHHVSAFVFGATVDILPRILFKRGVQERLRQAAEAKAPMVVDPTGAVAIGAAVIPVICVHYTSKNMAKIHFDKHSPLMYHDLIQLKFPEKEFGDESCLVCNSER